MRLVRVLFLLVSLSLVVLVTLWESENRVSPGPLHPFHAAVEGLDGIGGCGRCHGSGFGGVDAASCTECHERIARQIERKRGLHGRSAAQRIEACGTCHGEHHGSRLKLLDARSFALAGVEDRNRYDHRFVPDYALSGRHQELACEQCHRKAAAEMPPEGGRYLGLSATCTGCHEDKHRGDFGSDCGRCHGQQEPFDHSPGFAHTQEFPLAKAHANHSCQICHAPGTERGVAALQKRPLPPRGCADCHESPHEGAPGGEPRRAMPIADARDCSRCHGTSTFERHSVTNGTHAELGYPIRGVHEKLRCEGCHGEHGARPRWRGEAPGPTDCSRCHETPHRTVFVLSTLGGSAAVNDCAGCHLDAHDSFERGIITPEQHAVTGFPLDRPHDRIACAKCHEPSRAESPGAADALPRIPYAERFPGRDRRNCRSCHEDVHRGQFAGEAMLAACTRCHEEDHWIPPSFSIEDHRHSAFPLVGQHEAVACRSCHDRIIGGARRFAGTPHECRSCHEDPHGGRFDRAGLPKSVDGRAGCARCHDEIRFRPVRSSFEHGAWTGFPLVASHEAVACAKCHGRLAGSLALGKVLGKRCADCHSDVHMGQFRVGGETDCSRCHDEEKFRETKFDHQRDSRFRLDATHAGLLCAKCHVPVRTPEGEVTRYRPMGMECKDCHLPGGRKARTR